MPYSQIILPEQGPGVLVQGIQAQAVVAVDGIINQNMMICEDFLCRFPYK